MSYSSLYAVFKTRVRSLNEYKNGHGSAPPVWDLLSARYLGRDSWGVFNDDNKPLWALARNLDVPEHLRICHGMTFDRACVTRGDLLKVADFCRQTHDDILKTKWTWSHWPAIADDLASLAKKWPSRAIGISINCTSVGDAFDGYPEHGKQAFNVIGSYSTAALKAYYAPQGASQPIPPPEDGR